MILWPSEIVSIGSIILYILIGRLLARKNGLEYQTINFEQLIVTTILTTVIIALLQTAYLLLFGHPLRFE